MLANFNSNFKLIVASEIKAFLPFTKTLVPDKDKISALLFMDVIPENGSIFKDVYDVRPGNYSMFSLDNI